MADCRKCKHNYKPSTCEPKCNRMCDGESDFEPITNAMRIRSMSDEELAKNRIDRIDMYTKSDFKEYIGDFNGIEFSEEEAIKKELEWLQSEAE